MACQYEICSVEGVHHPPRISAFWFILVIVFFGSLFPLFQLSFDSLPSPNLSESEVGTTFNTRRAREFLVEFTKGGPKVAGSVRNEVFAVEYLVQELKKIQAAKHSSHMVDIDVQTTDSNRSHITYHGVQNVVARLRNSDVANPPTCLLINSHFDTGPVSPGGGDATTMVSVMLETLRVLATNEETFQNCIIFLFNGCEEIGLLGSHAFITQHKWAHSAKAVINLDAAGTGGREILFQKSRGHSWLMNYYRTHAPHPFTSALGEEIFQSGMIPSDTDFRVFKDKKIPGMDMATIMNGYVYHTKEDTAGIVPDGTLQHTGDNVLALARALANAEELKDTEAYKEEDTVFFDVWNSFIIYYSKETALIINSLVIVLCVVLQVILDVVGQRKNKIRSPWIWSVPTIVVQLVSLAIGCGISVGLGAFYDAIAKSMTWYHSTFLIGFLYMCPLFFFMAIGPVVLMKYSKKLSPWQSVEIMLHVNSWILMILLIMTMILDYRSGFMVMVPLFIYSCSLIFQIIFTALDWSAEIKLGFHYLMQIIPFGFFATWTVVIFGTFIPITGRSGGNSNPETIISGLAILFGILLMGFIIPTISMFKNSIGLSLIFALLWLIGFIMMFTPVGFPYAKDTTPKRLAVHHTLSTFYDLKGEIRREQSYFFTKGLDRNNHLIWDQLEDFEKVFTEDECDKEWLCGLPLFSEARDSSVLIHSPKPMIPGTVTNLQKMRTEQMNATSDRMHFRLTCTRNCEVWIHAAEGVKLGNCSLINGASKNPIYVGYVTNLYLENRPKTDFWVEINNHMQVSGKRMDIGVVAHFEEERNAYSTKFTEFLDVFPDWTTIEDWIVSYTYYEF